MKESTDKIITWVGLGIGLICAILSILFAVNIESNSGMFDITYWILICFVAISVIAMVAFWAVGFAKKVSEDPKYLWKSLAILGGVVVAVVISFALAKGNDVTPALLEKNGLSLGTSKLIGAACIFVYILVICAAIAIIATEVLKSLKKK